MTTTIERPSVAEPLEATVFDRRPTPIPSAALGIEMPYPVPSKQELGAEEFTEASALRQLGATLIARHPTMLGWLTAYRIAYLWRAKGGASGGLATLGKCAKATGLVKHFGGFDLVIWLAADHCRELSLSHRQIEALLFHELNHPAQDEETGNLGIKGHEFDGFLAELREYGPWSADLQLAARQLRQLRFDLDGDETGGDESEA